jgi:hypothetical protein
VDSTVTTCLFAGLECPKQNLNPSNFKKTGTDQLAVLPISDKTMCHKSKRKRKKKKPLIDSHITI